MPVHREARCKPTTHGDGNGKFLSRCMLRPHSPALGPGPGFWQIRQFRHFTCQPGTSSSRTDRKSLVLHPGKQRAMAANLKAGIAALKSTAAGGGSSVATTHSLRKILDAVGLPNMGALQTMAAKTTEFTESDITSVRATLKQLSSHTPTGCYGWEWASTRDSRKRAISARATTALL